MLNNLSFLLNNSIYEIITGTLCILNFSFIKYFDICENKSDTTININNLDKIGKYKITIIFLVCNILLFFLVINYSKLIVFFLIIIVPLFSLLFSITKIYNDKTSFSQDNNYIFVTATIIFLMLFSSNVTPIYINSFSNVSHLFKEILLILFLLLKIILFVFFTSTNIFVLISNISNLLIIKKNKLISDYFICKKINLSFINYNFELYKKYNNKLTLIIDIIIYIFLCIPTILLNFILFSILYFKKILFYRSYSFFIKIEKNDNGSLFIKIITNISIIVAFIFVYIILVIFKENFCLEVIEIYNFLSTVILLPLIYDSIKSNT